MNSKLSTKNLTICRYLQYLLLGISFFLFSSKIPISPWYIPLTTYVLLYILILIILQIILLVYTWYMYEKKDTFKIIRMICIFHFFLLLLMFFLCILNIKWFNLFSILVTILIVLLIIYQKKSYKMI